MKKKKNKQNGSTFLSPCSSDNIIQVDDRVNHFSWTEMKGSEKHSLSLRVSNPVVFIGDSDEELSQQIEKYKKDKEEPQTYIEIKKVIACLVPLKTT